MVALRVVGGWAARLLRGPRSARPEHRHLELAGNGWGTPARSQVRRPLPAVAPVRLPRARQTILLHCRRSAERYLDDGGDGFAMSASAVSVTFHEPLSSMTDAPLRVLER